MAGCMATSGVKGDAHDDGRTGPGAGGERFTDWHEITGLSPGNMTTERKAWLATRIVEMHPPDSPLIPPDEKDFSQ
jgi:hypothetical protein